MRSVPGDADERDAAEELSGSEREGLIAGTWPVGTTLRQVRRVAGAGDRAEAIRYLRRAQAQIEVLLKALR